jgi:hypothetical protein
MRFGIAVEDMSNLRAVLSRATKNHEDGMQVDPAVSHKPVRTEALAIAFGQGNCRAHHLV